MSQQQQQQSSQSTHTHTQDERVKSPIVQSPTSVDVDTDEFQPLVLSVNINHRSVTDASGKTVTEQSYTGTDGRTVVRRSVTMPGEHAPSPPQQLASLPQLPAMDTIMNNMDTDFETQRKNMAKSMRRAQQAAEEMFTNLKQTAGEYLGYPAEDSVPAIESNGNINTSNQIGHDDQKADNHDRTRANLEVARPVDKLPPHTDTTTNDIQDRNPLSHQQHDQAGL